MSKLFAINNKRKVTKFIGSPSKSIEDEGELQKFVERNMEDLFGIRYVANEVYIGGLRIDTIGVDGKNCPVLIEYKKGQGDRAPGQIFGYENLIEDNKDSFSLKVSHKLGNEASKNLNFNKIRLVCIAKDFHERVVRAWRGHSNVELITYRFFDHKILLLEWKKGEVKRPPDPKPPISSKMTNKNVQGLYKGLSDGIMKFGSDIKRSDRKNIRKFTRKTAFAFLRPVPTKGKVRVWVKLDPKKEEMVPGFISDVSDTATDAGSCNLEISVRTQVQLRKALGFCRRAYREQKTSLSKLGHKPNRPRAKKSSSSKSVRSSSLDYALHSSNPELRKLFHDFKKAIVGFGDVTPKNRRTQLQFMKHDKVFACLRPYPGLKKVQIWASLNPQHEKLRDGFTHDDTDAASKRWAPRHCNLKITAGRHEMQEALDLCRKACDQAKR